jgi:hypothetical protein
MSYKKTFILLVTDGTHGDVTACSNAAKLKWKEQFDEKLDTVPMGSTSSRVMIGTNKSFCDKGPEELTNVDEKDRLYILGHGSFGVSPTLGSKTADQLASYLYANGLRKVAVISLVSCNSGWGWGDILPGNVPQGYSSATHLPFGCQFAGALDNEGIHTEVRARVGFVTVGQNGRKFVELTEMKWVNKLIWVPKGWNKRSWRS